MKGNTMKMKGNTMKKITTLHGTSYLLDEENKTVVRVPKTSDEYKGFTHNNIENPYMEASDLDGGPIRVGGNLYIKYSPSAVMPWSCSTEIVSIEDTTKYPPEGQNEECDHTDDTGLCYCESGILRCPDCKTWLGCDHARKDIEADIAVMWPKK